MSSIEIEIDGKKLAGKPGDSIIQVADKAGIPIPRFCYHEKLSVAANCRMCLVDVEKAPKPLPACATPIAPGMIIHTCNKAALDAQKSVMEFLLINHPLDCPICDQGGQCELQDVSMGYGKDISRYTEGKRSVYDHDLGPLIATDMTRCIQCTRCVRFGAEIGGIREMGATGRGEHLEIGTYIQKSLTSELSGNMIDVCPVGALTSKPFRFRARAWELQQADSVAPHDCIGSNIHLHRRDQEVMRVVPRRNDAVNEMWISDRDRFSYQGLYSEDRLSVPLIKVNGVWEEVDWQTAFEFTVSQLKKVIEKHGATQIGGIAAPSSTLEEFYLFQKLLRGLGTHNIDHRLHQSDFVDHLQHDLYPSLGVALSELENQHTILLLGSDISREQPLAGTRIRKAAHKGAAVLAINCVDYPFNFDLKQKLVVHPGALLQTVAGVAKALAAENANEAVKDYLSRIDVHASHTAMAQALMSGEKKIILLGALAQNHPQASLIKNLADLIAKMSGAIVGILTEGANSTGAWLAGAVPHRLPAGLPGGKLGLDAHRQWRSQLKAYFLLNVEPELDCAHSSMVMQALEKAEFVVAVTPFRGQAQHYAQVILPSVPFTETAGTFVNIEGQWQSFMAATLPYEEARPAWKILRVLGNLFALENFDYVHTQEIRDELKFLVEGVPVRKHDEWKSMGELGEALDKLQRITEWPIYRGDNLVRRAAALQQSGSARPLSIRISPTLAARLHAHTGELWTVIQESVRVSLPLEVDASVPDNAVVVPAGYPQTAALGSTFGAILLERSV